MIRGINSNYIISVSKKKKKKKNYMISTFLLLNYTLYVLVIRKGATERREENEPCALFG